MGTFSTITNIQRGAFWMLIAGLSFTVMLVCVRYLDGRYPSVEVVFFRALAGLQQKYYLQDARTGEYGGCYLWDSTDAMAEYQQSELRATIAQAYEVEGEPRIEVYRIVKTLRD